MNAKASSFDEHADIYDLLIDWPKRLANEGPFYRQVFNEVGARRVLDVACGTGRHAMMFCGWGLEVEAADVSQGMIAQCRSQWGEPAGVRWVVRPFEQPSDAGPFDAVVCVGNSLALAGDERVIAKAVQAMLSVLRPGGVCVIHVLNLWKLPEDKTVWQKCLRVNHRGEEHILLKSIRRQGGRGHIDFVDLRLTDGGVSSRYDSADFVGLKAEDLTGMAQSHGATDVRWFGSYQQDPYEASASTDLILLCRR